MQSAAEQDRVPYNNDCDHAHQPIKEYHSPLPTKQSISMAPTAPPSLSPAAEDRVDAIDKGTPNTEVTSDMSERMIPASPLHTYHKTDGVVLRTPASAPPTTNRKLCSHNMALQGPPLSSPLSGGSVKGRWSHKGGDIPPLFREISAIGQSSRRSMVQKLEVPIVPDSYNARRRMSEPAPDYYKSKRISKLNAVWPPVRPTLGTTRLSLMRSQGVVPPLVVKSRRTSFEPRPAYVKNFQAALTEIRSSLPSEAETAQVNPSDFVHNRKARKRPQRRTSLRVRWGGPTVLLIDRIRNRLKQLGVEFDPALLSQDRFKESLRPDSCPSKPTRSSSFRGVDEDWYDQEVDFDSDAEGGPCHNRPDVWVTPGGIEAGVRSWRVKRQWNVPEFDQKEAEHTVDDSNVMNLVKALFGAEHAEIVDGKWIFEKGSGLPAETVLDSQWIKPDPGTTPEGEDAGEKPWKASWIFDEGGQIIEHLHILEEWLTEPEMLKQFQQLMEDEQNQIELESSMTPFQAIPEDEIPVKHKERAFARPDGWVSPVDGSRRVVQRRSWRPKAVDLTKDSGHSDITEDSGHVPVDDVVMPVVPNGLTKRKTKKSSWRKVELQDSMHSINTNSTDTTEAEETTLSEADPIPIVAQEEFKGELPKTIPRFDTAGIRLSATEFPPEEERKSLAHLLQPPKTPWKLVMFDEEKQPYAGYLSLSAKKTSKQG